MSGSKPSGKRATALRYDGPEAPRVVASGRNLVAEKILEAARDADVPVREDRRWRRWSSTPRSRRSCTRPSLRRSPGPTG
jgi:type III secretion system FlhB-like substrate exporter